MTLRDPRNPFRMRASEQIASDTTFLRLFGSGVLDSLPEEEAFSRPVIFRSAPGGGKTSMLRVFTPTSLNHLYSNRFSEDYRDLYLKMKDLGVVGGSGPQLLGIMLSCDKNYADLEDLPWEKVHRKRLFFALLNSRILLSTMRATLQLQNLEYPQDCHRVSIKGDSDILARLSIPAGGEGVKIFEWARDIEFEISAALDSIDPALPRMIGHDDLSSLDLLKADGIFLDGERAASRALIMFDDVHKLAPSQRRFLGEALGEARGVAIWIAERLEALETRDLLDIGSKHGRDYTDSAVTLERYWRSHHRRFEGTVRMIADKRVREVQQSNIGSFDSCVPENLDNPAIRVAFEDARVRTKEAVKKEWGDQTAFRDWIANTETAGGTAHESAIAWQTLNIQIVRENRRSQRQIQQRLLEAPLSPEGLEGRSKSDVRTAAELFLATANRLPYYYGFSKLSSLASSNIEQFLAIAGELFEEASSADILGKSHQLTIQRQDEILKRAARHWWRQSVLRGLPVRSEVQRFVESIARFASQQTYQANAPYAPGVTGVSITMEERDQLCDEDFILSRPDFGMLSRVIGICLAHNILEADLDHSQGYERRMVLYLNRLLCCYYDLPLQYGGWRAQTPHELTRWALEGFHGERLL